MPASKLKRPCDQLNIMHVNDFPCSHDCAQHNSNSQYHQPRDDSTIRPSLYNPNKRVRSNVPNILAGQSFWSETGRFNTAESTPLFVPPNGDRLYGDIGESLWPDVNNGSLGGGMSDSISAPRLTNLGSKATQEILQPGDTVSSGFLGSLFDDDGSGLTSRRQPVPGENIPFLAANGRKTTSSRGADNPWSDRSRSRADFGNIPKTTFRELGNARYDFGVEAEHEPFADFLLPTGALDSEGCGLFMDNECDLNFPLSSHVTQTTPMENLVPEFPWLDKRQENSRVIFDEDPWPSWLMVPNPAPTSSGSMLRTEPNLQADASILSEMPTRSSNQYDPYVWAPGDSTDEPTPSALPFLFDFESGKESILPEDFHFESAHNLSNMRSDTLMPRLDSYVSIIDKSSSISAANENEQPVGMGYVRGDFMTNFDYIPQQLPNDLLQLTTEDLGSSSYRSLSTSSQPRSSISSLPTPGTEISRRSRRKKQRKYMTTESLPYRELGSSTLILGSSEFSRESGSFLQSSHGEKSSANFAPYDSACSIKKVGDETSSRGQGLGYSPSETSAGSEIIEDLCHAKQKPEASCVKENPRSTPSINSNFPHLEYSPDNTPTVELSEDTNDTQPMIQAYLSQVNRKANSKRTSSNIPAVKIATTWQHTFVVLPTPRETSIEPPKKSSFKLGRRTGPLPIPIAEKAQKMRQLGSCLRCRIAKTSCSLEEVCERCKKVAMLPGNGWVCRRARLPEYTNLFLPEQAVSPFQKAFVDHIVSTGVLAVSDNCMEVFLTSGETYPSFKVMVSEFTAQDRNLLVFKRFEKEVDGVEIFKPAYSAPLVITDFSQDLNAEIIRHIQGIISGERNFGEVIYGNTSKLAWDMYEAIRLYCQANPESSFLRRVLMLHAMQYFMTVGIKIPEDSSEEVLNNLRRPNQLEYTPYLRLVPLQIKQIVLVMLQKAYHDVLEELENQLQPKSPALWAPTFCCIMILNMCAEMVQKTTNVRIASAIDEMIKSSDGQLSNGNIPSNEDCIRVCRILDDLPIASVTSHFHMVNKTEKPKNGKKRGKGFNPIRDGLGDGEGPSLGPGVEELITNISSIVTENCKYTQTREVR